MAGSTLTTQKIGSEFAWKSYDHDPGGTSATVMSTDGGTTKVILDMRDYDYIGVDAMTSVSASSSGITKLELVGYIDSDSTGAGTAYVIKDSGTVAATTLGNNVKIEATAAEIAQIGSDNGVALRYVTPRLTCSNSGDEAVVNVLRHSVRPYGGLTADSTVY